uniref:Signal transducer and activator of transcription n=1 Tax=Xiphophorus couchianus TaxID=32473 RepID=A0A3B5MDH2_9TELE
MSQWKQVQQLEMRLLEQVDYLYDDNFPMDIRQGLAGWIESQDWDSAVNDEAMASVLFTNLQTQLEKVRSQEQNFLQRHNMKIIQQQLQVTTPALFLVLHSKDEFSPKTSGIQLPGFQEHHVYFSFLFLSFSFPTETPNLSSSNIYSRKLVLLPSSSGFQEILSKMDVVIKEIDDLMTSQLRPELQDWKRRQQIAAIGGPLLTGLEQLQSWFTLTAQSLFQIKRQLDKLGELVVKVTYESDPIPLQKPQMEERVKYLIYHLIKSSFVVEKQPCMPTHPQKPLIIKTGVQFTTKLRGLLHRAGPRRRPGGQRLFPSPHAGCCCRSFLLSSPQTCSLPLVVISNVSQLPGGWASVMWYNLLTDEPRNLGFFGNPPRASWSQLSEVLSWQFSTFAGRGLNKEQLDMLGEKLLGTRLEPGAAKNIPGKPFSFWMWLDSILELIKKHLLPVWNENFIMGFVSKEMERALLKDREPGTFLLRFSESHLGGITFTWVEHNGFDKFNSVEPYTKNRLSALPFADIIRDYKVISNGGVPENPLKFLYPDIPKDEAFGRLYNSQSEASSTPRSCPSPEPPMTPGEFDMLSEHLCFDIDTVSFHAPRSPGVCPEQRGPRAIDATTSPPSGHVVLSSQDCFKLF